MGNKVGGFFKEVAKTAAKAGTSYALGKIPIIGDALANKINSMYKKGGKVKAFADGGEVAGKPTQAVNTPAQLMAAIKKFPDEAQKAGLSVAEVKEAVAEAKSGAVPVAQPVEAKKRGGRKKKAAKADMVELMPAKAKGGKVNLTPSIF